MSMLTKKNGREIWRARKTLWNGDVQIYIRFENGKVYSQETTILRGRHSAYEIDPRLDFEEHLKKSGYSFKVFDR
jgi:hypothetical protein